MTRRHIMAAFYMLAFLMILNRGSVASATSTDVQSSDVRDVRLFYEKLTPYGDWVHLDPLWLGVATTRSYTGLAAIHHRPLGLYRSRHDLGVGLGLGVGNVSLRSLDLQYAVWLGMGSRRRIGTSLGGLASRQWMGRLGTLAATGQLGPDTRPLG